MLEEKFENISISSNTIVSTFSSKPGGLSRATFISVLPGGVKRRVRTITSSYKGNERRYAS
jgi:hypothetical protein